MNETIHSFSKYRVHTIDNKRTGGRPCRNIMSPPSLDWYWRRHKNRFLKVAARLWQFRIISCRHRLQRNSYDVRATRGSMCRSLSRLSGVVLLTDEIVSISAVGFDPVILARPVEQQAVDTCRRLRAVDGRCSRCSPARVCDRFEVMFRCPHPLLVAYHEVSARPPTGDVLVLCTAPSSSTLTL